MIFRTIFQDQKLYWFIHNTKFREAILSFGISSVYDVSENSEENIAKYGGKLDGNKFY
jgi:hypothetical protein